MSGSGNKINDKLEHKTVDINGFQNTKKSFKMQGNSETFMHCFWDKLDALNFKQEQNI